MPQTVEPTLAVTNGPPQMGSIAAILLLAVIWGLSIPLTKLGLATFPPLTLTALRFAVAVPLLFAFSMRQRLPMHAVPRVALLGVIGISVGQVAQTFGIAGTSASVGAILSATIPVFVVAFAALRLRQTVSPRQMIGLLAAFAGIALVASSPSATAPALQTTAGGVVWMIVSSIAIAFYYVWSFELTRNYGTPAVAAWSTLFGFAALLPWTLWEMSRIAVQPTAAGIAIAAYLGVFVTVAGLFLWLHLLRTVTAVVATSVQYLHPLVGIVVAAAMFGDTLGLFFASGVVLILGGLALALGPARPRRRAATKAA